MTTPLSADPNAVSRRGFLRIGTATTLAGLASIGESRAAQVRPPPVIDTHLHCFAGPNDPRFPYHAQAPYQPPEAATPEHLLQCMTEAQVDYAIVVHPEPYQDDHRYLEHCLAAGRGKLKGTLLLFADRPGSLEQLPELCRKLDVVALRVHAHAEDRLPPFGTPELDRLWRLAAENGLAVQLHLVPKYAPGFEPLIEKHRDVRVVIDHMGRPLQGTPEEHAVVLRWARFDHTVMKLSSLPPPDETPDRDLQPIVRRLTDAWGAERMIYGDSFGPATTGETYAQAFNRARSLLSHLSSVDQSQVLGGTAARLFKFPA
jgi:predicted TIM-barrel fold metal-dependent hydrolase